MRQKTPLYQRLEEIRIIKLWKDYHENREAMGTLVISIVFPSLKSKEITKVISFTEYELN